MEVCDFCGNEYEVGAYIDNLHAQLRQLSKDINDNQDPDGDDPELRKKEDEKERIEKEIEETIPKNLTNMVEFADGVEGSNSASSKNLDTESDPERFPNFMIKNLETDSEQYDDALDKKSIVSAILGSRFWKNRRTGTAAKTFSGLDVRNDAGKIIHPGFVRPTVPHPLNANQKALFGRYSLEYSSNTNEYKYHGDTHIDRLAFNQLVQDFPFTAHLIRLFHKTTGYHANDCIINIYPADGTIGVHRDLHDAGPNTGNQPVCDIMSWTPLPSIYTAFILQTGSNTAANASFLTSRQALFFNRSALHTRISRLDKIYKNDAESDDEIENVDIPLKDMTINFTFRCIGSVAKYNVGDDKLREMDTNMFNRLVTKCKGKLNIVKPVAKKPVKKSTKKML